MRKKILGFAPKLNPDGSNNLPQIVMKMGVAYKVSFKITSYLITGSSPLASNETGKPAAITL